MWKRRKSEKADYGPRRHLTRHIKPGRATQATGAPRPSRMWRLPQAGDALPITFPVREMPLITVGRGEKRPGSVNASCTLCAVRISTLLPSSCRQQLDHARARPGDDAEGGRRFDGFSLGAASLSPRGEPCRGMPASPLLPVHPTRNADWPAYPTAVPLPRAAGASPCVRTQEGTSTATPLAGQPGLRDRSKSAAAAPAPAATAGEPGKTPKKKKKDRSRANSLEKGEAAAGPGEASPAEKRAERARRELDEVPSLWPDRPPPHSAVPHSSLTLSPLGLGGRCGGASTGGVLGRLAQNGDPPYTLMRRNP